MSNEPVAWRLIRELEAQSKKDTALSERLEKT